jgi:hypothetical protein
MRYEAVPMDWKVACVIPIYKGKGDKSECGNYRGIILLSVVGKVYGSVLIEEVKRITDEKIGEEQGGFRKGRGCIDQIFGVNQIIEKKLERQKELCVGFIDLEKGYDRVNREKMWDVLRKYDVNEKW